MEVRWAVWAVAAATGSAGVRACTGFDRARIRCGGSVCRSAIDLH